ncbi:MAG TPA: uroporphyrinogen-III C-methyltransferase [Actinocrinis sp.]|uniref:uroporphyrinogen-III C-methyltransferase n=1 Tax=Actinocrinis sp. TaxID=1920516 RepID=UPI002DDD17A3|nr:uroporphyrinogen-III C-methyltransferase [Actinocrinis sp.]HEV2343375.1 uroporphyrinogen-III C-methyltransferase [Actinocrinis sp.]
MSGPPGGASAPGAFPDLYIAGLRLSGRKVVVVGGGPVAARRVAGLLDAGAVIDLICPQATPALDALAADEQRITWHRRPYRAGDVAGAWYAVAATDDPAVNAAVAAEAEAARVFCSRADDAASSTAWTPAVGRHAGIEVAVLSPGVMQGGDPRRSQRVRDAVVEGLREGTLNAPRFRERPAGVALVGGGPGDPDLITVRGRRLLAEADVVVADRLAPRALLDELAADVELIDAAKIPYGRAMAQQEINRILVERAKAGSFVVRLKGGDPYVFGRGYEELLACTQEGIAVTVVPGVTSAIAVPALAGVPVTHRALAHEFTIVSGHLAPEHPESLVDWEALARMRGTLVLMMAVERVGAIAKTLIGHGKDPATAVAAVQDGSTPGQRAVYTTLAHAAADLAAAGVRPPAIVILGPAVELARRLEN